VTSGVSYVAGVAAEKTKQVGSTILETGSHIVDAGSHKLEEAKQNEMVSGVTHKAKDIAGQVGGAVVGATGVSLIRYD
jgi:hypothetical protein